MASLQDLPGVAEQFLAVFGAQLTAQGVTLPDRQYVAAGSMIVWDGEQLTACLMGITQGHPGAAFAQTYVPEALNLYASFSVNLVRKISVVNTEGFAGMEIPTAAELDADGQTLIADAQALILAASEIHRAHLLTGPGEDYVIDGLQPLGPEGGLVASRLLISVSLT
jgi:hypothetical protein